MRSVLGWIADRASAVGFVFLMAVAASEMSAGAYLAVLATVAATAIAVMAWARISWQRRRSVLFRG